MKIAFFAALLLCTISFTADAQLKLLKDINPGVNQFIYATPHSFTSVGGATFFIQTYDGASQVYRTNGTDVDRIDNGKWARCLTAFNGKLYFLGAPTGQRVTLWSVEPSGTAATAAVVFQHQYSDTLIVHNGNLYATLEYNLANPPAELHALVKTDGTQGGTSVIKSFNNFNGYARFRHLTSVGDKMYFAFGDNIDGEKVWMSDGTTAGTTMLDFSPGPGAAIDTYRNFTKGPGSLAYFTAMDKLYRTDGTVANTSVVYTAANTYEYPRELTSYNNKMYFVGYNSLWSSDGTAVGTTKVKQLSSPLGTQTPPKSVIIYHDSLFFVGNHALGGTDLWKSNGTTAGTVNAGITVGIGPGDYLTVFHDSIYWARESNLALSKYEGKNKTKIIYFVNDGPRVTGKMHATATHLFFPGSQLKQDNKECSEPWVTQGTSTSTRMLKDISHQGLGSADIVHEGVELNGKYFFGAKELYFSQLWSTDGTIQGTTKIKDISPVANGSGLSKFVKTGSTIYFAAQQVVGPEVAYHELWKSDGTAAGTVLVKVMDVTETFVLNNQAYILSDGRIFKTDGTDAGTVEVAPAVAGIFSGPVGVINNIAVFSGPGGVWRTNGTAAGTVAVVTSTEPMKHFVTTATPTFDKLYFYTNSNRLWVTDGSVFSMIHNFASDEIRGMSPLGPKVLLAAGNKLWISDSTGLGAMVLADARAELSTPAEKENSHVIGSNFFLSLSSNTNATGQELWKTDGTVAGTVIVKDIEPNVETSGLYNGISPVQITAHEDRVYFVAGPGGPTDLYVTKGEAASTQKIIPHTDLWIRKMIPLGNHLLISGFTFDLGVEMYVYDLDETKQDQTISFTTAATHTYGDASFQLTATATSGLPVTFTSSNTSVLKVAGNTVEIVGAGNANLIAHQDGNGEFNTAPDVSVAVTIAKRVSTIEFTSITTQLVGGADINLVATTNSNAPIVFSTSSSTVTISGNKATIVKAGTTKITASVADNGNNTAASKDVTFCINPFPPVVIQSPNSITLTSLSTANTWYKDGIVIPAQTGQQITVAESGVYTATTTVEGCTSGPSLPITVVILGLENASHGAVVSPNPAKDFVYVKTNGGDEVSLDLISSVGQSISHSIFTMVSENTYRGDVSSLSSGVYILRIKGQSNEIRRLIVSH